MSRQPMTILGGGMMTGVGLTGPASCAAIRAGLNNFEETRFMDGNGEWIVASEVPLQQPWRGPAKLGRMLAGVITETLDRHPSLDPKTTPVIVCLSEKDRAGRIDNLEQRISEVASEQLGFQWHPDSIVLTHGRVGGAVALGEARKLLYQQGHEAVIVAGVDSYLTAPTLKAFEERHRLLTEANSNGFIPGEAASAFALKKTWHSEQPQLVVLGLGYAMEQATVESEEPLRAEGLVQAIKNSLTDANVEMGFVDFRITDVSGEHYGFKEAALAMTRTLRERKEEFDIWHAADCTGETGAAAGPVAFNIALDANDAEYTKGPNVICHFASDDGKRAASILTYQVVNHGQ